MRNGPAQRDQPTCHAPEVAATPVAPHRPKAHGVADARSPRPTAVPGHRLDRSAGRETLGPRSQAAFCNIPRAPARAIASSGLAVGAEGSQPEACSTGAKGWSRWAAKTTRLSKETIVGVSLDTPANHRSVFRHAAERNIHRLSTSLCRPKRQAQRANSSSSSTLPNDSTNGRPVGPDGMCWGLPRACDPGWANGWPVGPDAQRATLANHPSVFRHAAERNIHRLSTSLCRPKRQAQRANSSPGPATLAGRTAGPLGRTRRAVAGHSFVGQAIQVVSAPGGFKPRPPMSIPPCHRLALNTPILHSPKPDNDSPRKGGPTSPGIKLPKTFATVQPW